MRIKPSPIRKLEAPGWRCAPLKAAALAALLLGLAPPSGAAPQRVVSMNLCTDQLAMLLAAPGQLHSVSSVALDPYASAMADTAGQYRINTGRAEQIYAMAPDMVLAGEYSARDTVALLRRLGIEVVEFGIAHSLEDVRARILQMGAALGREAAAQRMVARFDADLAQLREGQAGPPGPGAPRAALYTANGYTSGDASLSGDILAAAGFRNAPAEAGYGWGRLPLEVLAMLDPDLVITTRRYPSGSRAEEIMDHPVIARLRSRAQSAAISDQDWICGTPFALRAVARLVAARRRMEEAR